MKAKRKGKFRIRKSEIIIALIVMCLCVSTVSATVNFFKYPEQYMTTWKYQLKNRLAKGNEEALKYYNDRYVANGKYLFGDKYIVENEYLNLSTVVGYEASDEGVLLLTNDGNGYFIEK